MRTLVNFRFRRRLTSRSEVKPAERAAEAKIAHAQARRLTSRSEVKPAERAAEARIAPRGLA